MSRILDILERLSPNFKVSELDTASHFLLAGNRCENCQLRKAEHDIPRRCSQGCEEQHLHRHFRLLEVNDHRRAGLAPDYLAVLRGSGKV